MKKKKGGKEGNRRRKYEIQRKHLSRNISYLREFISTQKRNEDEKIH